MNTLAYERFIVNPLSLHARTQNKTAVSKLSSVHISLTYAMCLSWNVTIQSRSCASAPATRTEDAQASGRKGAQRRGVGAQSGQRRRKQSTVGLYWISSNIKRCVCGGRNRMWPNKIKKLPKAMLKLPVSGTEDVGLICLSLSQQTFSRQTQVGINKLPNYTHVKRPFSRLGLQVTW